MVLSKEELLNCLNKEVHILVHLCGKIHPEAVDYRPTSKQRSTLELLRYLTVMGPVLIDSIKAGSFLVEEWNAAEAKAAAMGLEEVVAALGGLSASYAAALADVEDASLRESVELFGRAGSRGAQLVDMVVCGHAAYRMQLFLYLKSSGRDELNTWNVWAGMDGEM